MRQTISALLLGAAGFLGSLVLERYVTAFPEWTWRAFGLLCLLAGLVGAALTDTGWTFLRSARPATLYVVAAIAGAAFNVAVVALIVRPLILEGALPRTNSEDVTTRLLEQQQRLEFLQRRTDKTEHVVFFVRLHQTYTADELGTFRILLTVLKPGTGTLYLSAMESYATWHSGASETLLFGTQHTAWSADQSLKLAEVLQDTVVGANRHTDQITAWSATGGPFATLQAFDNVLVIVHMTETLWPRWLI